MRVLFGMKPMSKISVTQSMDTQIAKPA